MMKSDLHYYLWFNDEMKIVLSCCEFLLKSISAALFGILLLLAFMITAPMAEQSYWGLYRYDYLLIFSLLVQAILLYFKLETWAEAKVIALFHLLGFVMELFLTHPAIASWHYPQPAVLKIETVPLFAGFMYSAVGSFFARSLRLFQVEFLHLPKFSILLTLAIIAYLNFMTKYFIWDIRNILFIVSILLFIKTTAVFKLKHYTLKVPMLLLLIVLAFIIWLAENVSTFYKIWLYPNQIEIWKMVSWQKMGSWYLLLLLSLVFVLKVLGQYTQGHWRLKPENIFK